MLRYRILRDGVETNSWTSDFAGADYYEPTFGKPLRWVREDQGEDITKALTTRIVQTPEGDVTEYQLAAEYTLTVEDLTAAMAAKISRDNARALKIKSIVDLKGKALTAQDMKAILEALVALLTDPESNLADTLIKLLTQPK